MKSNFKYIDNEFDFSKANKIVFSGSSIGGMGVFIWADYFKNLIKDSSKLYGIADSAIFLDPVLLQATA